MAISYIKTNLDPTAKCQDCQNSFNPQTPALAHDGRDPVHLGCLEKKIVEHLVGDGNDAILKCGACFAEVSDILGLPVERPLPNREYTNLLAQRIAAKGREPEILKTDVDSKPIGLAEKLRLKTAVPALLGLGLLYAWVQRGSIVDFSLSQLQPTHGMNLAEKCYLDAPSFLAEPCKTWLEKQPESMNGLDRQALAHWAQRALKEPNPGTRTFFAKLVFECLEKDPYVYLSYPEVRDPYFQNAEKFLNEQTASRFLQYYRDQLSAHTPIDEKSALQAVEMNLKKGDYPNRTLTLNVLEKLLDFGMGQDVAIRVIDDPEFDGYPQVADMAWKLVQKKVEKGGNEIRRHIERQGKRSSLSAQHFDVLQNWAAENKGVDLALEMIEMNLPSAMNDPRSTLFDGIFKLTYSLERKGIEKACEPAVQLLEKGIDSREDFKLEEAPIDLLTRMIQKGARKQLSIKVLSPVMDHPSFGLESQFAFAERLIDLKVEEAYPAIPKLLEKGVGYPQLRQQVIGLLRKLVSNGNYECAAQMILQQKSNYQHLWNPGKEEEGFFTQLSDLALELVKKDQHTKDVLDFWDILFRYSYHDCSVANEAEKHFQAALNDEEAFSNILKTLEIHGSFIWMTRNAMDQASKCIDGDCEPELLDSAFKIAARSYDWLFLQKCVDKKFLLPELKTWALEVLLSDHLSTDAKTEVLSFFQKNKIDLTAPLALPAPELAEKV